MSRVHQGVHRQGRSDEKAVSAYDMWMDGMNYAEIARELDVNRSTARARVLKGRAILHGDVEEKRDRIADAAMRDLDELYAIARDTAEDKDRIAAYNARRGVMEFFSKLHGLPEPVKAEVEHKGIQNIVLDSRVLGVEQPGVEAEDDG